MTLDASGVAIELNEVSVSLGNGGVSRSLFNAASARFNPGHIYSIMGPSGCGKSTLLRLMGGLQLPTSGSVSIDGVNLSSLSSRRLLGLRQRTIGFVFQDYNLIEVLTAVENVALALRLGGTSQRSAQEAAHRALEVFDLNQFADTYPNALSGGEQQRVAIARALATQSQVILADEPTGALDEASADLVIYEFRRLADAGRTCVVVTHSARVASQADVVLSLSDGGLTLCQQ